MVLLGGSFEIVTLVEAGDRPSSILKPVHPEPCQWRGQFLSLRSVCNESHSSWRGCYNPSIIGLRRCWVKPTSPEIWSSRRGLSCFLLSAIARPSNKLEFGPGIARRTLASKLLIPHSNSYRLRDLPCPFGIGAGLRTAIRSPEKMHSTADAHRGSGFTPVREPFRRPLTGHCVEAAPG